MHSDDDKPNPTALFCVDIPDDWLVKEQGATGLIAVTGAQVYVLHSPSFWALAIVAFGVVFFLFRNA